jgi:hypothetical protein
VIDFTNKFLMDARTLGRDRAIETIEKSGALPAPICKETGAALPHPIQEKMR